jgi:hypothetical protein
MPCRSCLQKAYDKYRAHGLSHETSLRMAQKLMKRVERRERKAKIRFFYQYVNRLLWKWTFLCNWKASIYHKRWIGKGFNPDYTQNCGGVCTQTTCPNYLVACTGILECIAGGIPNCAMGTCACPAALPNSTYVSGVCTCNHTANSCETCFAVTSRCSVHYVVCPCAGVCNYNCTPPFVWDGIQCSLPVTQLIELPKMDVGL